MPARRQYDPRLRELVHRTQNPAVVAGLGIPRTTVAGWLRGDFRPTTTSPLLSMREVELIEEVARQRHQIERLRAIIRILVVLVKLSGARLDRERLPQGRAKARVLRAVEGTSQVLGLDAALAVTRLSPARYHRWKALDRDCGLDDRPSCPRTSPAQLLPEEILAMRHMVTGPEHVHMYIGALAIHAQRIGRVFAAPETWLRLVRERGWKRPRVRRYPPKPKRGVRASRINQYWHIDVSVIRLIDRTKIYMHAVMDNYSRKILA